MADVVVVGAGLAGLAAAARLAKLGHQVTVLERNLHAGGAIRSIEQEGFVWDAGPSSMTLPAVVRDLFRKSGRPIERYVDLRLRSPARRHVFTDGTSVDLPTGSRAAQMAAVAAGLGPEAGTAWTSYVDAQSDVWDVLRREVLDRPDGGRRLSDRAVARKLRARTSLAQTVRASLKDERLRTMALHAVALTGSAPEDVPAHAAVDTYVERTFGVWEVAAVGAGMAGLTEALLARMVERSVAVRYGAEVVELAVTRAGSEVAVAGVVLADGERVSADVVVAAVGLRIVVRLLGSHVPAQFAAAVGRGVPAPSVSVTHLGLVDDPALSSLPAEVVLHGDPLLVVQTRGTAPAGCLAWTVWSRSSEPRESWSRAPADPLVTMAQRGIDARSLVRVRVDRSPHDVVAETGGSPFGWRADGYRAAAERAALIEPVRGLQLLGASVHPGAGIPYVAWGAAHVAERLGKD